MEGIPLSSVQQRHARAASLISLLAGVAWPACLICYVMAMGCLISDLRGLPAGRWQLWGLGALLAHAFALILDRREKTPL